jgi:hypothetical protein
MRTINFSHRKTSYNRDATLIFRKGGKNLRKEGKISQQGGKKEAEKIAILKQIN